MIDLQQNIESFLESKYYDDYEFNPTLYINSNVEYDDIWACRVPSLHGWDFMTSLALVISTKKSYTLQHIFSPQLFCDTNIESWTATKPNLAIPLNSRLRSCLPSHLNNLVVAKTSSRNELAHPLSCGGCHCRKSDLLCQYVNKWLTIRDLAHLTSLLELMTFHQLASTAMLPRWL